MNTLNGYIGEYIEYCEYRKRLDAKTLKAYRIDLNQYENYAGDSSDYFSRDRVDTFITDLHKQYKPKTVKRKIAGLKAFFHYLNYKEILLENPFDKLDIRFREAKLLPKTIPFHSIQTFLSALYEQKEQAVTANQLRCCWSRMLIFGIYRKCWDIVRLVRRRYIRMCRAGSRRIFCVIGIRGI